MHIVYEGSSIVFVYLKVLKGIYFGDWSEALEGWCVQTVDTNEVLITH